MAAWKLAPALACRQHGHLEAGRRNAAHSPASGRAGAEAGFPAGVVNILTGPGVPTGAALAAHNGVDKVAFTGSTEVGRKIMAAAAGSNLKRVSLELGGKSPNVVFADADLEKAIKGATWAVFSTSGQECVAGSRLFVEQARLSNGVDGLAAQARAHSGRPRLHAQGPHRSNRLGEAAETVLGYIDEAGGPGRRWSPAASGWAAIWPAATSWPRPSSPITMIRYRWSSRRYLVRWRP